MHQKYIPCRVFRRMVSSVYSILGKCPHKYPPEMKTLVLFVNSSSSPATVIA